MSLEGWKGGLKIVACRVLEAATVTQPYRYEAVVNCGSCVQILAAPPTTWPCTPKHKGVDLTGKHFRVAQGLVALELGTKQPQLWIIPRRNGAGEKCRSSLKERSGGVIILGPADGAKHRYPKAMSPGGLGFFGICRDRLLSPMTSPAIAFPKYLNKGKSRDAGRIHTYKKKVSKTGDWAERSERG